MRTTEQKDKRTDREGGIHPMKRLKAGIILALALILALPAAAPAETSSAGSSAPKRIVLTGSHDLAKGLTIQLKAAVKPSDASQKVKWESSDPSVAKVSKTGKVTGLNTGTVIITAKSAEKPSVRKNWKITVYDKPVKKIKLSASTKTLYMDVRKTIQLTAEVTPLSACNTLEWKSSDKKLATVSESGLVTIKKPGKVTITARAVDGSKKEASVTLTIRKKEPPLPEPDPDQPVNYYALLIGNSDYTVIQSLPSVKRDLKAMKNALSGLKQPWKITARKNLTGSQITSAIASAFEGATANDVCLFYYSGHGMEDMDFNPGALMGIGYDGDSAESDLLTAQRLRNHLDRACPGRVIVILEACGSGAVIYDGQPLSWEESGNSFSRAAVSAFRGAGKAEANTGELLSNKYTVLTTCEHGDYGVNLPVEGDTEGGLLTYCIARALGCGYPDGAYTGSMPADTDGDGTLTLRELKPFANGLLAEIKSRFPGESTQVFQYSGDNGMILFAR